MGKISGLLYKLKNNGIIDVLKGFFNSNDYMPYEYYGGFHEGSMDNILNTIGININNSEAVYENQKNEWDKIKSDPNIRKNIDEQLNKKGKSNLTIMERQLELASTYEEKIYWQDKILSAKKEYEEKILSAEKEER